MSALILALDPGTTQTGWVLFDGARVHDSGCYSNERVLQAVCQQRWRESKALLAVEMIASYGMPVGREVFETCVWIGRFKQAWYAPDDVLLVYRRDVKLHLCGSSRAKDSNVRQALIDLFPPSGGGATPQIGTKSRPGPLYGVSTHAWPALGVAVTEHARLHPAIAVGPQGSLLDDGGAPAPAMPQIERVPVTAGDDEDPFA